MATYPEQCERAAPVLRLVPFRAEYAERVVGWVHGAQDAYWLAPKAKPPLTAEEVLRWQVPEHEPLALELAGQAAPIGYGELNRLSRARRRYWLGHVIVDPALRGRGYGAEFTRLLLRRAFVQRGAHEVTLVVFPANEAAVACYRAAGFRENGYETHEFAAHGRRERLLRMAAPPRDYR